MPLTPLPRAFFDRSSGEVAPELLGCLLVRRARGGLRVARIVETEAYLGPHDQASHSRFGLTERNRTMFGEPGRLYVYLIYGLHHCMNAVCGPGRHASAVLLRAAEPVEALEGRALRPPPHSTVGPGNLCRALDVHRRHDRVDLCSARSPLFLAPRDGPPPEAVRSPRVGIDYAGDWVREPLRFTVRASRFVSRPVPRDPG